MFGGGDGSVAVVAVALVSVMGCVTPGFLDTEARGAGKGLMGEVDGSLGVVLLFWSAFGGCAAAGAGVEVCGENLGGGRPCGFFKPLI